MQTNLDQCPMCGSELSQAKFREIRMKQREQEEKRKTELAESRLAITRELEQELGKQFEQDKRAAEKKVREETAQLVRKAIAQREEVAQKLKESEARVVETHRQAQLEIAKQRHDAEKKAKADVDQQLKKLTAERDQTAKKLKDAEVREAQVRKQAVQDANAQKQKELADQRQAFETDRTVALFKQQTEFNRQRESFQKKIHLMENQLQRKTANELGDGGEIDVFEALREAFDGNGGRTTRIPKGENGADILHDVFHKGEACGRIIIDAKNRQAWQNIFVTKLRQDQVQAGAEQAILATTVFPAGKKEMCIESGVIVIAPPRVVHIVQLLRQAMITMHVKGLSLKERASKMSRLYSLITSEAYATKFTEANRLTQDMLQLEVQEKTAHDNVWKKRGTILKQIHNVLREVETEVTAVIEGNEGTEPVPPVFDNRPVTARSPN